MLWNFEDLNLGEEEARHTPRGRRLWLRLSRYAETHSSGVELYLSIDLSKSYLLYHAHTHTEPYSHTIFFSYRFSRLLRSSTSLLRCATPTWRYHGTLSSSPTVLSTTCQSCSAQGKLLLIDLNNWTWLLYFSRIHFPNKDSQFLIWL